MPSDRFPGPNINRLIETDPQIVKIALDQVEWGMRKSIQNVLVNDASRSGGAPSNPSAPEMTIKHVGR